MNPTTERRGPHLGLEELKAAAAEMRAMDVVSIYAAGSGHPGGTLSVMDVVAALYLNVLNHDPASPVWPERESLHSLAAAHPALFASALCAGCVPQLFLCGMRIVTIDPALKARCPRASLGCLTASVRTQESSQSLREEMQACEAHLLKLPEPRAVLESPKILATRAGYKALGKDPARYRGSAEALLRRILSGKNFPQINVVVDIINLVSVESRFPIGLYDLANVKGGILFRAGRAGETYKGIGKYDLNLEGLPVFCDEVGPHGSPTSDSERTMVTPATENVLAIFVSFGGTEGLEPSSQEMSSLLQKYAEGREIEIAIVT